MHSLSKAPAGVIVALLAACGGGNNAPAPQPAAATLTASTVYLGPFVGDGATLHPDNVSPHHIEYYGTDLGFSYQQGTQLVFLFGDSWATEKYAPIEASTGSRFDDSFGSVDLGQWADASRITPSSIPLVKLGQNPGTTEASAIDPGHAMDLGKTPMAGFSNGTNEFGIFNITKPLGCSKDEDCKNGLTCDTTLGYIGARYLQEENLTLPCRDGTPRCNADTMMDAALTPVSGSGFCADQTSVMRGERVSNLLSAIGLRVLVGVRDPVTPKKYGHTHEWLTNKFMNVTVRTVESFDPAEGAGRVHQDYRPAQGSGGNRRLLLWGRPGFIGVKKNGRTMSLYFAYADLPSDPDYEWKLNYYAGSSNGMPQFSPQERDAQPVDLDSSREGVQQEEVHDITDQVSVAWVEPLGKWVMFYGGGLSNLPTAALPLCGVLQLFTGPECKDVDMGNGAMRMRTADDPWGPWTPPQDILVVGSPEKGPHDQYGPGGALRHPACNDPTCAPHSDMFAYSKDEYGFFYSANIIEQWTRPAGDGVDILWNASTWDPYRVVLLKTHLSK
jgi:hypothetical protein